MKLMHISDLHLGKSLGDFDLTEDQAYILNQLLAIADEESVDGVLIAGDVYDKAVPSEAATRLLDYFLSSLAERKIDVFMISGNHDSDERLQFGSRLFESNHVFISAKFEGALYRQTMKKDGVEADIYLLPFVKASQVKHFYPEAGIESYEDALRLILKEAPIDRSRLNILVAHQFVTGESEDPRLSGSEGLATQSVGLVEKISYNCFDSFDYVALGHIHSPQQLGREEVRYAGSPLKYSLSEIRNEKSVPLITLNGKGKAEIKLYPLRPLRDMRHLRGTLKELLDPSRAEAAEDFIYATLTDEEMTEDVMGIMQQRYPNTVKVDYDNSHTREIEQTDISAIAEQRSFTELIGDFYKAVYGWDISEEEMAVMRSVAREAGLLHEAD